MQAYPINKLQSVTTGKRIDGKLVSQPAHQAVKHLHGKRLVSDIMAPPPNKNSFSNRTQIKYFLENEFLNPWRCGIHISTYQ